MNDLGAGILKILEASSLGRMSVYVLSKQSVDLGIDLNSISQHEARVLVGRLNTVLPFFLGHETNEVITSIKKFVSNGSMVMT